MRTPPEAHKHRFDWLPHALHRLPHAFHRLPHALPENLALRRKYFITCVGLCNFFITLANKTPRDRCLATRCRTLTAQERTGGVGTAQINLPE